MLFNISSILKILAALLLVLLNGLFVAAEFAFVKVRPTRIDQLASRGNHSAIQTKICIDHLDAYLSVSQLGITLASLGLGWLGEPAIAQLIHPLLHKLGISNSALLHSLSFFIAFAAITFLHVVFGELAPKSLGIQKSEKIALLLSTPMRIFYYIFYPGVLLLNGTANRVLRLIGIGMTKEHESSLSSEELRMLISASFHEGQIKANEQELLQNVFKFEKRVVEEIMVPRPQVVFLFHEDSMEENLKIARDSGHTRFPLVKNSPDHVVGLIHIKDIFHINDKSAKIEDFKRDILFIPEGSSLDSLLKQFQRTHQHLAIVIDEYGGTAGIVTMDNILEELVGDIQDEFDEEKPEITVMTDGHVLLSGGIDLEEAIENLELPIDDDKQYYSTLGGFVMGQLGKLPEVGNIIYLDGYKLEVIKMDDNRIDILSLSPIPENLREK